MNYVLGIDIGGTNTVAGIVDNKGTILYELHFETKKYSSINYLIQDIYIKYLEFQRESDINISGIGIGAPNGNYYNGYIEFAPNLKWGNNIPIVKITENIFHLPVKLTNDANAAAIGEKFFGCAKEMNNFVVLTLGTGLGSGIYVNGNIIHGEHGYAGEFGHTKFDNIDRLCNCGSNGCLETVVSSRGIKQTYKDIYFSEHNTIFLTEISVPDIYKLALQNDNIAYKTFEYTARILAKGLVNLITILDPEAIILFGGIANAHKLLIPIIEIEINKEVLNVFKNKVKILPSALLNKNAAVLGSAALLFNSKL